MKESYIRHFSVAQYQAQVEVSVQNHDLMLECSFPSNHAVYQLVSIVKNLKYKELGNKYTSNK